MNSQAIGATEATHQAILQDVDAQRYVQRSLMMLASLGVVDSGGRQRVTVDAFGATAVLAQVTVVPTVSSVTNIAGYIGVGSRLFVDLSKMAFSQCLRRPVYG